MISNIIIFNPISVLDILKLIGGAITIYFLFRRFKTTDDIKKQQDKHFTQDNRFRSFLESTRMLTDKDSTIEAKISALYLLYDVAKDHPEDTERILQILSKQISPLLKFIENEDNSEVISLESLDRKQNIIEWAYQGNDLEKVISNSLTIIKKISLLEKISYLELDNSIIFDLDAKYQKDINNLIKNLRSKDMPTKNLTFLHCNLQSIDFSKINLHYCKFINCNLQSVNFENSNLWGTLFKNSNLKSTNFNNSECEGIEFQDNFNLEKNQIDKMTFLNIDRSNKDALIILSDISNIPELKCFKDVDEYKKWKSDIRTK